VGHVINPIKSELMTFCGPHTTLTVKYISNQSCTVENQYPVPGLAEYSAWNNVGFTDSIYSSRKCCV